MRWTKYNLILALTGLMIAAQAAAMGGGPDMSVNYWEVLVFPQEDHVEFAVIFARERRQNPEAINSATHRVRSIEAMTARLGELPTGAWIFIYYYDARLAPAASQALRARLEVACRTQNCRCAFAF